MNQRGRAPREVLARPGLRVWRSEVPNSADRYLALFNLDSVHRRIELAWPEVGLRATRRRVRDLWARRALGPADALRVDLAPHASVLYRVGPG